MIIALAAALSFGSIQTYAEQYQIPVRLSQQIIVAADRHDIPRDLAFALVKVESNFKPTARSKAGALGLTQLMPATARLLRPRVTNRQLLDPAINLDLGFRYLRLMLDKYPTTGMALAAYNRGPGYVDRAPEWQYVRVVLALLPEVP